MDGNWSAEEKREIFEAYSVQVADAFKYGEKPNIKANLRVLEKIFSHRVTGEQMVSAIYQHMLRSTDIVKPKHIEEIVNPPNEVTQAQFIHASKEYERDLKNGQVQFMCPNKKIIDEYQEQNTSKSIDLPRELKKILPNKKFIE